MNTTNPEIRFFANDVRELISELNLLSEEIVGIEAGRGSEFALEDFRDAMVRLRNIRLVLEGKLPAESEGGAA